MFCFSRAKLNSAEGRKRRTVLACQGRGGRWKLACLPVLLVNVLWEGRSVGSRWLEMSGVTGHCCKGWRGSHYYSPCNRVLGESNAQRYLHASLPATRHLSTARGMLLCLHHLPGKQAIELHHIALTEPVTVKRKPATKKPTTRTFRTRQLSFVKHPPLRPVENDARLKCRTSLHQ